jgi:energy-coupling factor transporter ATP-binding protein EcfA2
VTDHPLILIENLHFAYPPQREGDEPVRVLRGVDLKVSAGECLAIMGPTDAGKTTLCLTLNGLVPQATDGDFDGQVVVAGRDTARHSVAVLSQVVGLVFQDPETQLFSMTVEEEVAFGLESLGLARAVIADRIEWALDVVGLQAFRSRAPLQLSGGQKQRLAIAVVLAMQPPILVLDEPMAALDPVGKRDVLNVLAQLKRRHNTTIIVAEQDPEAVAAIADRVVVLVAGQIVHQGLPQAVLSDVAALHEIGLAAPQLSELASTLRARTGQRFAFIAEAEAAAALRADLGCSPSG